jgi:hypothetical protein
MPLQIRPENVGVWLAEPETQRNIMAKFKILFRSVDLNRAVVRGNVNHPIDPLRFI